MRLHLIFVGAAALAACSAMAAPSGVGDWTIDAGNNGRSGMMTKNDGGSMFGHWCEGQTCYWMLVAQAPCIPSQALTPALISNGSEVKSFDFICVGETATGSGLYRRAFATPELVQALVMATNQISVVIGADGTAFRSFKFSTQKAEQAEKKLENEVFGFHFQMEQKAAPKDDKAL